MCSKISITHMIIICTHLDGKSPTEAKSHVVIVWRQDIRRLSYSWLSQPFVSGADNWNSSLDHLHRTLTKIMGTSQPLAHQTIVKVQIRSICCLLLQFYVTVYI